MMMLEVVIVGRESSYDEYNEELVTYINQKRHNFNFEQSFDLKISSFNPF